MGCGLMPTKPHVFRNLLAASSVRLWQRPSQPVKSGRTWRQHAAASRQHHPTSTLGRRNVSRALPCLPTLYTKVSFSDAIKSSVYPLHVPAQHVASRITGQSCYFTPSSYRPSLKPTVRVSPASLAASQNRLYCAQPSAAAASRCCRRWPPGDAESSESERRTQAAWNATCAPMSVITHPLNIAGRFLD